MGIAEAILKVLFLLGLLFSEEKVNERLPGKESSEQEEKPVNNKCGCCPDGNHRCGYNKQTNNYTFCDCWFDEYERCPYSVNGFIIDNLDR